MGNGKDIDLFNIVIRLILLGIMISYLRPLEFFKNPPNPDDAKFNDFKHEKLEYEKYRQNGGTENYSTFLKKFREDYQKKYFENLFNQQSKKDKDLKSLEKQNNSKNIDNNADEANLYDNEFEE